MYNQQALVIFLKNPEPGKAKTRIAQEVGDEIALEIYRQLIKRTQVATLPWIGDKYVYYSSFIDYEDNWKEENYQKRLQGQGDLGQKMAAAFIELKDKYTKLAIIGSDCYQLNTKIIDQAFEALSYYDIVLGPSKDGGYYLLGLQEYYPQLFTNIPWSTDRVTGITIDRIESLGLSYHLLTELQDIDYYQDWLDQRDG